MTCRKTKPPNNATKSHTTNPPNNETAVVNILNNILGINFMRTTTPDNTKTYAVPAHTYQRIKGAVRRIVSIARTVPIPNLFLRK